MVLQFAVLTTGEIVQWPGNAGEVLDEMLEISYGTYEFPNASDSGGGSHVGDLLDTFLARQYAFWQKFRVPSR